MTARSSRWGHVLVAASALVGVLAVASGSSATPTRGSVPSPASSDPAPTAPAGAGDSGLWQVTGAARPTSSANPDPDAVQLRGSRHTFVSLDRAAMVGALRAAPMEGAEAARSAAHVLELPTPDGGFARFAIEESPVMEDALAAKYPEITSYAGAGVDDPTARVRLDIGPAGFHAQVLSPNGRWYVDPSRHMDDSEYVSYFSTDLISRHGEFVEHGVIDAAAGRIAQGAADSAVAVERSSGAKLKVYRLAVAATGEYSQFFGGTKSLVLAEINTAVNRVTGIYEDEVTARLKLVANEDEIIYLNPGTDPFNNFDANAMLNKLQPTIDNKIGSANYDIGHGFSTGAGGLAYLGVIGEPGMKARGVTGTSNPTGDAYWVDYVAHEMGHQFGGDHTFNGANGSCGGNIEKAAAMEPGSGSTIQAYAGICGADDLQLHSDPYFHSYSYEQIRTEINSVPNVGATKNTGNAVPTVSVSGGSRYTIPPRTPFVLTATGRDGDGDALTYTWEQYDGGAQRALTAVNKPNGALFRSFSPTTSRSRYFPKLSTIAADLTNAEGNCPALPGGLDCWVEYLPTSARTMTFRATVRDNSSGGGGVNSTDATVKVAGTAPFLVTSPDGGESYAGRTMQTIDWNVAGTAGGQVDTPKVDILMSFDGGLTFPRVLASGVANDGSHDVLLPSDGTTQGRIMVRGHGNIFFDTSDADFTLTAGTGVSDAPTGVTGKAGNKQVKVSWAAPADLGGSAITQYTVKAAPGGKSCSTSGARSCTVTGLTNGTAYRFTVKATNATGPSAASAPSARVTPRTVPGQPRDVEATAGDNRVTVSWSRPSSNGGSPVTRYLAVASPSGKTCSTKGALQCTIKNLQAGTRYTVEVRAVNAAGHGAFSPPSNGVRPF